MLKYPALILFAIVFLTMPATAQNQAKFSDIVPGMKDEAIEKQAIILANKRGQNYSWHEEYKKAVIISRKWEPDLDKNGFSKGRKIHVELYAQLRNGKCAMADFTFKQKLLPDGTLSKTLSYDSVGDMVFVECE